MNGFELMKHQHNLANRILIELGINIVSCGTCGNVLLQDIKAEKEEIKCVSCGSTGDIADFPNVFY